MINFMLSQIQSLEAQVNQSTDIVRSNVDLDRDNIIKLKSELRQNTDQSANTLSQLGARLTTMETQLEREEKMRHDLQQQLKTSEAQSNELANFIKSLSS